MRNLLFTATVVMLVTTAALAQQGTTGELTGVVTTESGPVPGVALTLTSPSLQGSRSTVSGESGGYHFALLPPGDYTILLELQGLETSRQRVRVLLAQTTRADVTLQVATLSESIAIVADTFDTAQIASNFRGELVENLPTGRTLRDIALLAPSVNANGLRDRLLIAGAPFWSSLFLVDGAVVNDNLAGQPHDLFVEDAIEETTVLVGAISPEYGKFSGGVVSVRTRSGGNTAAGSLRTTLTNPAWTARRPGETERTNDLSEVYEATLGGYAVKDRLWFFTAGRFADQSTQQTTTRTNIPYSATTSESRWEAKLTGQHRKHNVVLSYLQYSLDETNVVGTPAGVLDLDALTPARSNPAQFLTAGYHSTLAASTFLEAQYSRKTYAQQGNGGLSKDRILGTLVGGLRFGNLNAPHSCGVCGDDERNNDSLLIKATHYRPSRFGSHTLLAGVENFREQRVFNFNRSSSDYFIHTARFRTDGQSVYPTFDSATVINWAPVLVSSNGTDFDTSSFFLNDRWDISPRVSFSIGARYDVNDTRDSDGNLVSDAHSISPRLTASFDPRGDDTHRITVGYGRYVSKIPEFPTLGGTAQIAGNPQTYGWRYGGPEINPLNEEPGRLLSSRQALAQLFAWFDSVGGVDNRDFLVSLSIPGLSTIVPRSLRSPTVDETTLSYALRIGRRAELRADATMREWGGFYAVQLDKTTGQRHDPSGKPNDVSWIVSDDSETSRTYRAVQLQGTWTAGSVRAGGGYTWSKLRGNEDGEGALGGGEPATNRPLALWYPEILGYPQRRPVGYLTGDQRHRTRVWLTYDVPLAGQSLNVSLFQSFDSGRAYSVAGVIDASGTSTPYPGSPANPGYAVTQLSAAGYPYYFGERGALRTDDVWSTDLALNFRLPLRGVSAFLQCDVLNALNRSAVISPSTEVLTLARSGRASGLEAFNPFTTVPVEGVHYRLASDFGKPTGPASYQPPRTYGFSLGLRF
jgi:hypothetical protein